MWYLTGATNEAYVSSTESFSKQELDAIIQIFDDGKLKYGIASALTGGDVNAITIIGPATIVKEMKRNPKKIELLMNG